MNRKTFGHVAAEFVLADNDTRIFRLKLAALAASLLLRMAFQQKFLSDEKFSLETGYIWPCNEIVFRWISPSKKMIRIPFIYSEKVRLCPL